MRDIWNNIEKWHKAGKSVILATVTNVGGSSLRPAGSKIAISSTGEIAGSVTGGCVEGAVFEEAKTVERTTVPKLVSYGVTNEQAWEVGLSCGGSVSIFVESMTTSPWKVIEPALQDCMSKNCLASVTTIVSGSGLGNKMLVYTDGRQVGSLGEPDFNARVVSMLPKDFANHDPFELTLQGPSDEIKIFVDFLIPPQRLIIVGASHIAIPLVELANTLDFHTIVVDARSAFATRERFPHADELIVDWPADAIERLGLDAATCVVCLSHDDKQDNPTLLAAIESEARYIGALGSKVTHSKRLDALREEGADEEKLKRIHAPIGLKIGAKQPAEIAVSIMAEIVATRHGFGA